MNFERKCSVMGRKMKFGCLVKKGVAEVRERDLPEVGPYDVLLHMKVCNICTTDYGQWLGLREHQGYPMAGGHEAAGIVEAGWRKSNRSQSRRYGSNWIRRMRTLSCLS